MIPLTTERLVLRNWEERDRPLSNAESARAVAVLDALREAMRHRPGYAGDLERLDGVRLRALMGTLWVKDAGWVAELRSRFSV